MARTASIAIPHASPTKTHATRRTGLSYRSGFAAGAVSQAAGGDEHVLHCASRRERRSPAAAKGGARTAPLCCNRTSPPQSELPFTSRPTLSARSVPRVPSQWTAPQRRARPGTPGDGSPTWSPRQWKQASSSPAAGCSSAIRSAAAAKSRAWSTRTPGRSRCRGRSLSSGEGRSSTKSRNGSDRGRHRKRPRDTSAPWRGRGRWLASPRLLVAYQSLNGR